MTMVEGLGKRGASAEDVVHTRLSPLGRQFDCHRMQGAHSFAGSSSCREQQRSCLESERCRLEAEAARAITKLHAKRVMALGLRTQFCDLLGRRKERIEVLKSEAKVLHDLLYGALSFRACGTDDGPTASRGKRVVPSKSDLDGDERAREKQTESAQQFRDESRQYLEASRQQRDILFRQLQTEQLRVTMLQSAVEAERAQQSTALESAEMRCNLFEQECIQADHLRAADLILHEELAQLATKEVADFARESATAEHRTKELGEEIAVAESEALGLDTALQEAAVTAPRSQQEAAAEITSRNEVGILVPLRATSTRLAEEKQRYQTALSVCQLHRQQAATLQHTLDTLETRLGDVPELILRFRDGWAGDARLSAAKVQLDNVRRVCDRTENKLRQQRSRNAELGAARRAAAMHRVRSLEEELLAVRIQFQELSTQSEGCDVGSVGGWLSWLLPGRDVSTRESNRSPEALLERRLAQALGTRALLQSGYEEEVLKVTPSEVHVPPVRPLEVRSPIPGPQDVKYNEADRLAATARRLEAQLRERWLRREDHELQKLRTRVEALQTALERKDTQIAARLRVQQQRVTG